MASNINGLVFVLLAVANLLHGSVAKTFTVGDDLGWIIPTVGSQFYVNWATNKTFTLGDTLVFNFQLNANAVAKVTKSAFDSCNGTNALVVMTKPPAKVSLMSAGQQYFICTVTGHCSAGQKLSINVSPAPATVCSNGTHCPNATADNSSITLSPTPTPTPTPTPMLTFLSPSPLSNFPLQIHRATTGSDSNWKRTVVIAGLVMLSHKKHSWSVKFYIPIHAMKTFV